MVNREETELFSDPSSSALDDDHYIDSPEKHFIKRFTRYLRFGGIVQRIAEERGIRRDEVVTKGKSQQQDASSGRGHEIHAAHAVRANINKAGLLSSKNLAELKKILGHTHHVVREANTWNGIGGAIDRFQETGLDDLHMIDFKEMQSAESRRVNCAKIKTMKEEYISTLEQSKTKYKLSDVIGEAIDKAIESLREFNETDLHSKGIKGYTNEYDDN